MRLHELVCFGNQDLGAPAFGSSWTFLELRNLATKISKELRGVESGARVAVEFKGDDLAYFLASAAAISLMNAIFVPFEADLPVTKRIEIFKQTDPSAIISGKKVELIGGGGRPHDSTEIAAIFFSSGSTGTPKGVMLSHAALFHVTKILSAAGGVGPGHRELLVARPTHMDGWQRISSALAMGGTVIPAPAASLTILAELSNREGADGVYIPPHIARFSPLPAIPFRPGMAVIELGSGTMEESRLQVLVRQLGATNIIYHYGLTEISRATILDCLNSSGKLGSCGIATEGVEISIRNDDGEVLPPGKLGEIWLRGPQMMSGYWKNPALTSERLIGGWFKTGDAGVLDHENFLYFKGRLDDLISRFGFRFYPAEAERETAALIEGLRPIFLSSDTETSNSSAIVFIGPKPEHERRIEIDQILRRNLPAYMRPDFILFLEDAPLTPSGKVDRRKLAKSIFG